MAEDSRTIELKVAGMTCAMCARTIEHSLLDLDGTTDAKVNLGNETVRVEYDPSRLKLADLEKAVTDVSYRVVMSRIKLNIFSGFCVQYGTHPCCGRDTLPVFWNYVQTRARRVCDGYEFCDGGESISDAQGICAAGKSLAPPRLYLPLSSSCQIF